jgi:hypothetical protein
LLAPIDQGIAYLHGGQQRLLQIPLLKARSHASWLRPTQIRAARLPE